MIPTRSWTARALLVAWMTSSFATGAETIVKYYPHTGELEAIDTAKARVFTDFGSPTDTATAHNITFNLYFEDIRLSNGTGFDGANGAAAIARIKDVLTYIADVLNVPAARTLDVRFNVSQNDGTGFLASAGALYSASNGYFDGSAFFRLDTGNKLFAGFEEIAVTVDFGYNWNFTSGAPELDQADYISVLLHEMTHGLGIASLTTSTGESALFQMFATQTFTTWEQLATRGDGGTPVWSGDPPSVNNAADLTSGAVFFDGPQARAAYDQGGAAPGIYAPGTFAQGSSISHFNTGNIVGGAVMEHILSAGVAIRNYRAVEIGALRDLGYANAAAAAGEGEGEGADPFAIHTADQDADNRISLGELLRVIQFFNSPGFSCATPPESTEDGYQPGAGGTGCAPHGSDYNPQNFQISLSELLRLIQFFNSGGYFACPNPPSEDGFCPGASAR